jgi:hypothetical protein
MKIEECQIFVILLTTPQRLPDTRPPGIFSARSFSAIDQLAEGHGTMSIIPPSAIRLRKAQAQNVRIAVISA